MSVCPHCGQPMPAATLSQRIVEWRASNGLPLGDVAVMVGESNLAVFHRGIWHTIEFKKSAFEQRIETVIKKGAITMNVTHLCGCPIERLYSFESGHPLYTDALNQELHACPQCGDSLCDTDMRCADGQWLSIYQQTPWSLARRAAWDAARLG